MAVRVGLMSLITYVFGIGLVSSPISPAINGEKKSREILNTPISCKLGDRAKYSQPWFLAKRQSVFTPTIQSEGKITFGSISRALQAYYLEKERFTTEKEELGVEIPWDNDFYQYEVIINLSKKTAHVFGLAKKAGLKSYTSTVFNIYDGKEFDTFLKLCQSDRPTIVKPPAPQVVGNRAICPMGYNNLK
jgi:hypothetical protein